MSRFWIGIICCGLSLSLSASPKLVGAWQLSTDATFRLYLEKNNQAFLSNRAELNAGTWSWDEGQSALLLQWETHSETWQVTNIKNQEWTAETKGQVLLWVKAEGLKPRDNRLYKRRILGFWTTTDSLYQEKWMLIFKKKLCKERNANGSERILQWALSDDARFLQTKDKDANLNSIIEIVDLKDFTMVLQLHGGQLKFQRTLFDTPKLLEVYIAEQRLLGEWLLLNPTEEVKEFKMIFHADGSVQSLTDGEPIYETWKITKRGRKLTLYSAEDETRYELDLKFSRKGNTIELKEPEGVLKLNRVVVP